MANRSAKSTWRAWLFVGLLGSVLFIAPACSRFRHHTTTRAGTLVISPPSGPPGTAFSLTAGGLRPGEPMTFEIDAPNKTKFVGPTHSAGPDGRVTSIYTPQTGDAPGIYQVKAVGSRGTRAAARLSIVPGPSSTTSR